MEDKWEDFWFTGRITDYLAYRNSSEENGAAISDYERIEGKGSGANGTVRGADRDGSDGHAY